MSFTHLVEKLRSAKVRVEELGDQGRIAICPIGGRIIGLAFKHRDTNLLWTNSEILEREELGISSLRFIPRTNR